MRKNPVQAAVENAGGAIALAKSLRMTPEGVRLWVKNRRVPAKRVLKVEAITGVSRHDLNPDVYGPRPELAEASA